MQGVIQCIIISCLTALVVIQVLSEEETILDVPGVHIENLPDAMFYNTFVPIIYELPLPEWSILDMKIQWPPNYGGSCNKSDNFSDTWNQMACPVQYHMNKLAERIHRDLMLWNDFNFTDAVKSIEFSSCDKIVPHFKSFSIGFKEQNEYLFEHLKNCPINEIGYTKVSSIWKFVNTTIYATMLRRYIEENTATQRYRVTGFEKYATTTNSYTALQFGEYLDYFMTSTRWTSAIETCESYKIPYTLIPKETFALSLKEMSELVASKNYKFTVPQSDISTYYKLSLADCTFTTKRSFLIRILVPLTTTKSTYKLISINSIPFLNQSEQVTKICEYNHQIETLIVDKNNSEIFIPTKCYPHELCLIPDMANRQLLDPCVFALASNSTDEIIMHCILQCKEISSTNLPYFRKIASDRYAILGSSKFKIFLSCEGKPVNVINPPDSMGTLEIVLPCNCQVVYKSESLHSLHPCNKDLSINTIMPHHWSLKNTATVNSQGNGKETFERISNKSNSDTPTYFNEHYYVNLQFTILSTIVIALILGNIIIVFLLIRLNQRLRNHEISSSARGTCNLYETPMFLRTNDD